MTASDGTAGLFRRLSGHRAGSRRAPRACTLAVVKQAIVPSAGSLLGRRGVSICNEQRRLVIGFMIPADRGGKAEVFSDFVVASKLQCKPQSNKAGRSLSGEGGAARPPRKLLQSKVLFQLSGDRGNRGLVYCTPSARVAWCSGRSRHSEVFHSQLNFCGAKSDVALLQARNWQLSKLMPGRV